MHLAEAFLATLSVREDLAVQQALVELCTAMHARFIDPQHGVLMEKPLGAVDNWFEPGHQFEWYFLLESSALLRGSTLHASLERAFAFTEQLGVDQQTGAVRAMLDLGPDGGVAGRDTAYLGPGRVPARIDAASGQRGCGTAPIAGVAATLAARGRLV